MNEFSALSDEQLDDHLSREIYMHGAKGEIIDRILGEKIRREAERKRGQINTEKIKVKIS